MEHEVADCVENYVLGEYFWNSHCLGLAAASAAATVLFASVNFVAFFAAPDAFEGLAKIIKITHEAAKFLSVFVHAILIILNAAIPPLLILLNSFLKFLIEHFLQHTLPNIFFLPYTMVVDILGQIDLLTIFAGRTDSQSLLSQRHPSHLPVVLQLRIPVRSIHFLLTLVVEELTRIQNCVDYFEIHVFLVDYCC